MLSEWLTFHAILVAKISFVCFSHHIISQKLSQMAGMWWQQVSCRICYLFTYISLPSGPYKQEYNSKNTAKHIRIEILHSIVRALHKEKVSNGGSLKTPVIGVLDSGQDG